MQIYKRILVAMDCSPVDDVIIEHITALAIQSSAKIFLIHVVHSHTLDQDRELRKQAEACLESRCEMLMSRGIETHIVIRSGEPDKELLAEIESKDYDLVAMATHGHSFVGDFLYGSVSRTLKHRISVPLLLIGPRQ